MKSKKIMALMLTVMMVLSVIMPVNVFAANDVKSWIASGSSVGVNEAVQIRLVSSAPISTVPDGIVTVDGSVVTQSYDATTQTVSVVPAIPFKIGDKKVVKVDKTKFAEIGATYSGQESYNVRVRDDRIKNYGTVLNDTFDDGTTCGWTAGMGHTVTLTPTTLESGEKVLKAVLPSVTFGGTWADNEKQSSFFKYVGGGVDYTGDNLVRVKARVKTTASTDSFMIKANRPNGVSQTLPLRVSHFSTYMITGFDGTKPLYGQGIATTGGVTNGYKNINAVSLLPDGSSLNYSSVNLTGKWIDYTVIFDGTTNDAVVYASFEHNGETVTVKSGEGSTIVNVDYGYSTEFGRDFLNLSTRKTFNALDVLTFASKNSTSEETIYVDSVTVENLPKSVVKAEIPANTPEGIIYKPTTLDVKFNGDINYKNAGIAIQNKATGDVYVDGSYNAETKTYTADFGGGALPKGDYVLIISNTVSPVNHIPNKISSVSFESRNIEFSVYDSMPPAVTDVEISGRLIPEREVSVASYNFTAENDDEGAHIFEWMAADSAEGEFTIIENESESSLDITEELATKYVKVKMTAVGASGLVGYSAESNVLAPEAKPVAKGLKLSLAVPMCESDIEAIYLYEDANGDEETGTEIKWYVANSPEEAGKNVATGKVYKIKEADKGKYIYCTVVPKNAAGYLDEGDLYTSEIVGPVLSKDDMLAATNLLKNPSFEDGLEHYTATSNNWSPNIDLIYGEARTGDISLKLYKRDTDASLHGQWGQYVPVVAGKRYLAGCWARSVDSNKREIQDFGPYVPTAGATLLDTEVDGENKNQTDLSYYKFAKITGAVETTADTEALIGFTSFVSRSICDVNLDDVYFGELMISDINTNYVDQIEIPVEGEKRVSLTNGAIYNQLGTQNGFYDQEVVIEIPEYEGVSVEGNELVVKDSAVAGKIVVDIVCRPDYTGAAQNEFKKTMKINLASHGDDSPRATNVSISGTFAEGSELTGSYKFLQINGKENASTVRWLYSDTYDGSYSEIPGANELNYVIGSEYADKFILMEVTPVTVDGEKGKAVRSNILTMERAPVVTDAKITGTFYIGSTVKAEATAVDYNDSDEELTFEYRWFVSDNKNSGFTVIEGQTSNELLIDSSYKDKYIKAGVTAVSENQPSRSEEFLTSACLGPVVPVITDAKIKQNGTRLVADYIYNHANGIKESGTTYEWTVGGKVVSTTSDYTINFTGTKSVTLTITPSAESEPCKGAPVTVSKTVTGANNSSIGGSVSTGGGGYGGGGFGGSSSSVGSGSSVSGVTPINGMQYGDKKEPEKETDITNHWGKEYIKIMETMGVMTADENGNFNPDKNASREEMLTYLFKALGLKQTEYKNEFEDVKDGEFAKMLQTMVDNGTIAKDINFRPGDTITREEMCKILYISLENAGKLKKNENMEIESFEDFDKVADWAKEYVNAIYTNKIMVGVSDVSFDPKGTVTKAQAATMLVRIDTLIKGGAGK